MDERCDDPFSHGREPYGMTIHSYIVPFATCSETSSSYHLLLRNKPRATPNALDLSIGMALACQYGP